MTTENTKSKLQIISLLHSLLVWNCQHPFHSPLHSMVSCLILQLHFLHIGIAHESWLTRCSWHGHGLGCAPRSSASVVSCSNPVFVYPLNMPVWPGNLSVLNSFDSNDATRKMWICELSSSASTRMMALYISNTYGDRSNSGDPDFLRAVSSHRWPCRNFKGTERIRKVHQATLKNISAANCSLQVSNYVLYSIFRGFVKWGGPQNHELQALQ